MLSYVPGFTRVMIDEGEEVLWQQEQCANSRGMLNATKVKAVFARLVREAIRAQRRDRYCVHLCRVLQFFCFCVASENTHRTPTQSLLFLP